MMGKLSGYMAEFAQSVSLSDFVASLYGWSNVALVKFVTSVRIRTCTHVISIPFDTVGVVVNSVTILE